MTAIPRRPIRIAAQLHPQHGDFASIRRATVEAEEMGYDIVYTWDHFYPLYGPPDGEHFEAWTLLTALAAATERVEVGHLVVCNSYRNPNLVADMARTVDHTTGGRFILGLGSGWFERDYDEYGFEFGTPATRLRHLERNLPVIEERLAVLNPPPLRDIPILIAGAGERISLRTIARHADSWHGRFPDRPESMIPKVAALRQWCEVEGTNAEGIEWGVGMHPYDLDRFLAEDAETYLELGFTQFTVGFNGPAWPVANGADWLAWRDEANHRTG